MKSGKGQKINKTFVDNVKPSDKKHEYPDSELRGFYLRVMPSGVKTFIVCARVAGRRTEDGQLANKVTYTIGRAGVMTADDARKFAAETLKQMALGNDPRELDHEAEQLEQEDKRKAEVELKKTELTIRSVFEDWCTVERQRPERKTKESTISLYEDVLFKHVQDWLDKPLNSITKDMVSKRYRLVATSTVGSANNTFRALRMLFNWAINEYRDSSDNSLIVMNPVTTLSDRKEWMEVKPRKKFIKDEDLRAWYLAVCKLQNKTVRDYFLFLAVTGFRSKEAATLKWSDVDFKAKCFTAIGTKNGTDHTLPMTDYTHNLLKARLKATGGTRAENGDSFVFESEMKQGSPIDDVRWHEKLIEDESKVEFSPHVLRATFSMVAATEVSEVERKALLNHLSKSDVSFCQMLCFE